MQQAIESALREGFYKDVVAALSCARARAYRATNLAMVEAYWEVGRLIVVEEQRGETRAEYAAFLLPRLAERLTREYGQRVAPRPISSTSGCSISHFRGLAWKKSVTRCVTD